MNTMPNKTLKIIAFDLDQTIFNHLKGEEAGVKKIYDVFLSHKGIDFSSVHEEYVKINIEMWNKFEEGNYEATFIIDNRFKYLAHLYGVEEQVDDMKTMYLDKYIEECTPFLGAHNLLEQLKTINTPLIVGSNGCADIQTKKLSRSQLNKYFLKFYYGNKAPLCKPHLDFFEHILQDLQVKAHEVLFIGDSEKHDINPAKEIGMHTLHINQEYLEGEKLMCDKILTQVLNLNTFTQTSC
jgi:putative hydrolase of the HAD superfamily